MICAKNLFALGLAYSPICGVCVDNNRFVQYDVVIYSCRLTIRLVKGSFTNIVVHDGGGERDISIIPPA